MWPEQGARGGRPAKTNDPASPTGVPPPNTHTQKSRGSSEQGVMEPDLPFGQELGCMESGLRWGRQALRGRVGLLFPEKLQGAGGWA